MNTIISINEQTIINNFLYLFNQVINKFSLLNIINNKYIQKDIKIGIHKIL